MMWELDYVWLKFVPASAVRHWRKINFLGEIKDFVSDVYLGEIN
jgi:hypothetical protein